MSSKSLIFILPLIALVATASLLLAARSERRTGESICRSNPAYSRAEIEACKKGVELFSKPARSQSPANACIRLFDDYFRQHACQEGVVKHQLQGGKDGVLSRQSTDELKAGKTSVIERAIEI